MTIRIAAVVATAVATLAVASCGGSDDPESVVRDFASAYERNDVDGACKLVGSVGSGELSIALEDAVGKSPTASAKLTKTLSSVKDENGVCPANISLARMFDADPRSITELDVRDVDQDNEQATVMTNQGDWTLNEVDGDWRLSNLAPVASRRFVPLLRPR